MAHLYDTRYSEKTQPGIYFPQLLPPTYYEYFKGEIRQHICAVLPHRSYGAKDPPVCLLCTLSA